VEKKRNKRAIEKLYIFLLLFNFRKDNKKKKTTIIGQTISKKSCAFLSYFLSKKLYLSFFL